MLKKHDEDVKFKSVEIRNIWKRFVGEFLLKIIFVLFEFCFYLPNENIFFRIVKLLPSQMLPFLPWIFFICELTQKGKREKSLRRTPSSWISFSRKENCKKYDLKFRNDCMKEEVWKSCYSSNFFELFIALKHLNSLCRLLLRRNLQHEIFKLSRDSPSEDVFTSLKYT
jgi:hypothetical protein